MTTCAAFALCSSPPTADATAEAADLAALTKVLTMDDEAAGAAAEMDFGKGLE